MTNKKLVRVTLIIAFVMILFPPYEIDHFSSSVVPYDQKMRQQKQLLKTGTPHHRTVEYAPIWSVPRTVSLWAQVEVIHHRIDIVRLFFQLGFVVVGAGCLVFFSDESQKKRSDD